MTNNSNLPPHCVQSSQIVAHTAEITSALKNVIFYIQGRKIHPLKTAISTNIMLRVSPCKDS